MQFEDLTFDVVQVNGFAKVLCLKNSRGNNILQLKPDQSLLANSVKTVYRSQCLDNKVTFFMS